MENSKNNSDDDNMDNDKKFNDKIDYKKEIDRIKQKISQNLHNASKIKDNLTQNLEMPPKGPSVNIEKEEIEKDEKNIKKENSFNEVEINEKEQEKESITNKNEQILENLPSHIISSQQNDLPISLNELQSESNINNQFIGTFNPLQQRAEPPKKGEDQPLQTQSNQNNISQLSVSSMHQKFQTQLKKIEETSETNRIEQEQSMLSLREIENKLRIDQRLTHENREIRKNACKEITEMCQNDFDSEEDKKEFFEVFSPWVKFCIEETNAYVIPEALNYFITFNTVFPEQNSNSIKDFFDNIERLTSFGISTINELCKRVIFLFGKDKKLFISTLSELLKCLNNGSIRLLKFIGDVYLEMINKNLLGDNHIKIIFEKSLHIYNSSKGTGKNNTEKRKQYGNIITLIYQIIEDDLPTIKHCVHITSAKEFDTLLSKIKKKEPKYRIYPKLDLDLSEHLATNNNNDINSNNIIATDGNVPEKEKNANLPEEVHDLSSVLPNDFFEYVFITQFQKKLTILEEVNKILPKIKSVRDKDNKNFTDIYKIINISIEDSNILIHLEGIKILGHIARLLNNEINVQKVKLILESCFYKFKDKKSLVKNELFNLFDNIIENDCLPCESFILFMFQFCLNQQKVTPVVKQSILEYIKMLFKTPKNKIKKLLSKLIDKHYFSFTKNIVDIIGSESLSKVKDLCSDLLVIIKSKVNDEDQFNQLIQNLPNYRKKIIEQNNENNGSNVQTEANYKKNLRKIKSNLSFVRSRSISKNDRGSSNLSNSKLNTSYRTEQNSSTSTPKNNKMKSQNLLKRINSSKQNLKVVQKNNINMDEKIDKKDKKTNIKQTKKIGKENDIDTRKEEKEIEKDKNSKKETLEQKKDDVLNNISNQDEKALETYSKNLVRDFLYFVNKVSNGELKEDLSCHFTIIFKVLEKILERMIFLFSQPSSDKLIPNKNKLLENLINRMIKVVILVPCISQIEGSSEFDNSIFENFIQKIKNHSINKENLYIHLLIHLIKFSNKGEGFFENVSTKPSIIYFLRFVHEGYEELKSEKIVEIVNEFLKETNILTEKEKEEFYFKDQDGKIILDNEEESITQNMDEIEDVKENKKEIEPNIGINSENCSKIDHVDHQLNEIIIEGEKRIEEKEEDDFLARKIKESQLLINQKEIENQKLREKIEKMYQKKKESLFSKTSSPNNASTNENSSPQNKLNIVNTSPLNTSNIPTDKNEINKIIEENKERIINNIKNSSGEKGTENILKIKEQLNLTTKKLGMALQRMVQQTESKEKGISERLHSIKNESSQPQSPFKEIKEHPAFTEQSEIQSTISKASNCNTLTEIFPSQLQPQLSPHKMLINKLIQVLEGKIADEDIFSNLTLTYKKMTSLESKLDYIKYLRTSLDNPLFISKISINLFLQLYEFLLNILSGEILLSPKEENIIVYLQEIAEHLKKHRNITDMLKLMLFLLRKYFPKSLNLKISDTSLVMIKVITYLIKELLKVLVTVKSANPKEILTEINELFLVTPPSTLTNLTPNASLYQQVFTVLKYLTDELCKINKSEMKEVLEYLEKNIIVCTEYMSYLRKLTSQ